MTFFSALSDVFVNLFAGDYFIVGIIIIIFLVISLIFIRALNNVILSMLLFILYGLSKASIIPKWIFFISLIFVGIYIGKGLLNLFFNPN